MIILLNQLLMSLQTEVKEATFVARGTNQFDIYIYIILINPSFLCLVSLASFFWGQALLFFEGCYLVFNSIGDNQSSIPSVELLWL
mgnify:CR=1 FL=1